MARSGPSTSTRAPSTPRSSCACPPLVTASDTPRSRSATPSSCSPTSILLYVDDVDSLFRPAVAAGATETRPVANQFYGDRSGSLKDPFGHNWHLSTHQEDVSPEELNRRVAAMAKASTA